MNTPEPAKYWELCSAQSQRWWAGPTRHRSRRLTLHPHRRTDGEKKGERRNKGWAWCENHYIMRFRGLNKRVQAKSRNENEGPFNLESIWKTNIFRPEYTERRHQSIELQWRRLRRQNRAGLWVANAMQLDPQPYWAECVARNMDWTKTTLNKTRNRVNFNSSCHSTVSRWWGQKMFWLPILHTFQDWNPKTESKHAQYWNEKKNQNPNLTRE